MSPRFLSIDEVVEIHRDQIERYGGAGGIRDQGLLESALGQPAAIFGDRFLHRDLYEMAADLFHLVQNHPFQDGNKRVGAVAAIVFLDLNDVELDLPEDELERLVMDVSQGRLGKVELTASIRAFTRPR